MVGRQAEQHGEVSRFAVGLTLDHLLDLREMLVDLRQDARAPERKLRDL